MSEPDLQIVGGGPAGMSAAIEASSHGVSTRVIDEGPTLGGQIYRQKLTAPEGEIRGEGDPGDQLRRQIAAQGDRIEVLSNTVVWGVSDQRLAVTANDEETETLRSKILVLATGAYEYVPPFPGWTLPGVMTPGAAQTLAKTMDIVPGKRILVAGSGPFLLAVAGQLAERGAHVAAVLEATPRSAWLALPFKSPRTLDLIKEGFDYLRILKRKGVPVRYGRIVTAAAGEGDLSTVAHAPVDGDWNPDRSREETEEIDTLAIAYGFVPRIYLPQIAGCELVFQPELGGWIPKRDRDMATSVRDVYAVGDGSGVAGSLTACLEGRLAGLMAARRLGAVSEAEAARFRQPIERELNRVGTLRRELDRICLIRPGLSTLITDETIVCRCEEVGWNEARQSIGHGGCDFRTLKVMTRLGMGICQGRFCWPSMSRLIAQHNGCSIERVGPASPQMPVRPISIGALASMPIADDRVEP